MGDGESSLWGGGSTMEWGMDWECVEKIAEYLNYACRHLPFQIFLTVIFWYHCTESIQNRVNRGASHTFNG